MFCRRGFGLRRRNVFSSFFQSLSWPPCGEAAALVLSSSPSFAGGRLSAKGLGRVLSAAFTEAPRCRCRRAPHHSNTTCVDRRASGGNPDPWISFSPDFEGPHGPLPPGSPSEKVGGRSPPPPFYDGFPEGRPQSRILRNTSRKVRVALRGPPRCVGKFGREMGEKSSPMCV